MAKAANKRENTFPIPSAPPSFKEKVIEPPHENRIVKRVALDRAIRPHLGLLPTMQDRFKIRDFSIINTGLDLFTLSALWDDIQGGIRFFSQKEMMDDKKGEGSTYERREGQSF